MNQQATVRWVAPPGGEIIVPLSNLAGLILQTPVAGATPTATGALYYSE
jgi:hypothetical protein